MNLLKKAVRASLAGSHAQSTHDRTWILAIGAATFCLSGGAAMAQDATPEDANEGDEAFSLMEVVVTATAGKERTAFRASSAVSSLNQNDIAATAPRNTAELLRSIPGIRSESSGGSGNANISVRGIPVATGGGKFLQLHEDGMPVMQFGDIVLGTADQFLRVDSTVARVEGVRSGAAIAFASNSPGGVVNFISKTGEEEGGSIGFSRGVGYDNFRTDFEYGAPISDTLRYHVGGFYRIGEGTREAPFKAEQGGQFKFNITKAFGTGNYARLYFKYLNDSVPTYLPMPVRVTGRADSARFSSLPGFDALTGSNLSLGLSRINTSTGRTGSIEDGNVSKSVALGGDFHFETEGGLEVNEKFRYARNSGTFTGAFSANVVAADNFASVSSAASLAGANGIRYVGSSTNLTVAELRALNGNGLLQNIRTFDSDLNDLSNFTNDINVSWEIGETLLTAGYYKAYQADDITWYWQTYVQDVSDTPRLLDLYNGATRLTSDGLVAYGAPDWGGCCYRDTDVRADLDAFYVSVSSTVGESVNIDAAVRYDEGEGYGHYNVGRALPIDVDGDGIIQPWEQFSQDFRDTAAPLNWDWDYLSWSVGANWQLNDALAIYGRAGSGGRASDPSRLGDGGFFTPGVVNDNGNIADDSDHSEVRSYEIGVKNLGERHALFATVFFTETDDAANSDGTRGAGLPAIIREYESMGVELEGELSLGGFRLRGNATWTDAEIKFANTPGIIGNVPRRQADFIYAITPSYELGDGALGLSVVGSSEAFTSDGNDLTMPAYTIVSAFGRYKVGDLLLSVSVNNLFDEFALSECEEGGLPGLIGGTGLSANARVARCRPFPGTTAEFGVSYKF